MKGENFERLLLFIFLTWFWNLSHRFNAVKSTGLKPAQKRCWSVKVLLRKASVCSSSRSWGGLWTRRNRCPTGKDVHCGPVKSHMQVSCWCSAETEGCFSHSCTFLKINILRSLTYWKQTLSLHLVADAYCLLEVYTVLNRNPAHFGLPNDLQNISSRQSEKSKDKKPKEQQPEQVKWAQGKEARALLHGLFSPLYYSYMHVHKSQKHGCGWSPLPELSDFHSDAYMCCNTWIKYTCKPTTAVEHLTCSKRWYLFAVPISSRGAHI